MSKRRWAFIPVAALTVTLVPATPLSGQEQDPSYGPMSLQQAIELALETHPTMGRARAEEEAAGARVEQAQATRLPALASQLSLSRYQEPMVVAPLHGFDPMHPPAFDRNLARGALSVGYTLFDGGARGARIDQAEAGERLARIGGVDAGMGLILQVSEAYLRVLSGMEIVEAVVAQRTALETEVERVRLFLEEGKAAQVALLRAQAALSRVEAQEISARSELELAQGRLARFTGLVPEEVTPEGLSGIRSRDEALPPREAVLEEARETNPRLLGAREQVTAAGAGRSVARAAWFPRLEANGQLSNFGTLDGGHVQEWQGTLHLSYPLFTGGARKGEDERARAEEKRAVETLRLVELEVEEGVDEAMAAVEEARALREALQLAAEQSEEVARIEALALEAGAGVQTDFLRAQAELFHARASLSQARHGEVMARLQLARIRGVLSPVWIQENMEMER